MHRAEYYDFMNDTNTRHKYLSLIFMFYFVQMHSILQKVTFGGHSFFCACIKTYDSQQVIASPSTEESHFDLCSISLPPQLTGCWTCHGHTASLTHKHSPLSSSLNRPEVITPRPPSAPRQAMRLWPLVLRSPLVITIIMASLQTLVISSPPCFPPLMMSAHSDWLWVPVMTHSSSVPHLMKWTMLFKVKKVPVH